MPRRNGSAHPAEFPDLFAPRPGEPLLICGVDEAGRGPLAGPVYAAAVILGAPIEGLDDSKVLGPATRERLAGCIKAEARAFSIAFASEAEIDSINILEASMLAMRRAVDALGADFEEIWVDGNRLPHWPYRSRAIVQGDALVKEISAASILAKTARDAVMLEHAARFPEYGFERNKGYPTDEHLRALRRHGPCAIHRRSFAPVAAAMARARRRAAR